MKTELAAFANYLALAYHEARNVRHLVKAGHLDRTSYRLLIDGLSTDRVEAWKQVQPLRRAAAGANSAQEAEGVFQRKFGTSLEQLVILSENVSWSGTQRGGNRWAHINLALLELRNAIDQRHEQRTEELLQQLPTMRHNTGSVGDKLTNLDRCL